MELDAKKIVRPESAKVQAGRKPLVQPRETEILNLTDLTKSGFQHMSPAEVARLSGLIGNRAVERLMAQRQDEAEDETVPGPRTRTLKKEEGQRRGSNELRSAQRGSRVAGLAGNIGDAFNVDGQGGYGWDRPMDGGDVLDVVNDLLTTQSVLTEGKRIVIFSGHHGTEKGNLVGPVPSFLAEDQTTAANAMSTYPGSQIEVIDDPSTYPTKASMSPAFTSTAYIRIYAWCFSKRSYNNQATLKSNWWPAPDHINLSP